MACALASEQKTHVDHVVLLNEAQKLITDPAESRILHAFVPCLSTYAGPDVSELLLAEVLEIRDR